MPPYRAQRQSLNEIGGPQDTGPGPDYGRAIDALTHGASSLIQQAYLRKQTERQHQLQADAIKYQRSRDTMEDQRADRKEQFERDKFTHERRKDQQEALYKGYHEPAPAGQSAIKDAMTGHPSEPHYDVERSVPYRTSTDRAAISGEMAAQRQRERLDAQQAGRVFAAKAAQDLARLRAALEKDKAASGITRAMTAGQKESMLQKTAAGLLAQTNGSYDDAVALLNNTPEGQTLAKEGLLPRHLMIAHGQFVTTATGQAIRMQGSLGMDTGESVGAVRATREAVRGSTTAPRAAPPKVDTAPVPATKKEGPVAAPKLTAPQAKGDTAAKKTTMAPRERALQLQKEGKSRADILKIMKAEGYNVVDSSQK